ncbi:fumarylacetoacetate hydrolase family protein [Conexibacter woesei]|uniref:Fumarylacetoacetate (FAA) hydrolase n=1 Tax=Conexibacter woesei (strain DSM 14684 / CCUG 47730 / CIP 108061 / JCM 11494 / NBRC 100937 / ID131577) TaxID=469383 RepID=D3F4E8_CONWI|nr:fumarylacetoacetate hydrolase family protein [Conexibacter woesei]ADB50520.1 fumarylacetoacetate (FAA) hydrolase [Conexibacter woesei DSM 14684]
MRIARFTTTASDSARVGLVLDEQLLDLSYLGYDDPVALLALDARGRAELAERARVDAARVDRSEARLLAPIARPPKFFGVGFNYRTHVEELGGEVDREDMRRLAQVGDAMRAGFPSSRFVTVFNKQSSCVVGPDDDVWMPYDADWVDFEGEVAVVIGRRARRLSPADAAQVVAGYLLCNDVSVREWQFESPTIWLGKSFETHGPLGPWITTADEIADLDAVEIRTWVNDEERQRGNLGELVTPIPEIVSQLSHVCTLEPGDVIATGSPAGVGISDGRYLKVGDTVRIEAAELGVLRNTVVAEPGAPASAGRDVDRSAA